MVLHPPCQINSWVMILDEYLPVEVKIPLSAYGRSINSTGKRGQHALMATLYGHEKAVSLMSVSGYKTSLLVSLSKNGKVIVWDTTAASSSLCATGCVGMTSVPDAPVGLKCHASLLYIASSSYVIAIDLRTMRRVFTIVHQATVHSFEAIPSKSILCTGGAGRGILWDTRRVSDTPKFEPMVELDGHVGPVNTCTWMHTKW